MIASLMLVSSLKMQRRLCVLFALVSSGAYAQWLNYPTPGIPRTRDGKPNLTAPAPRAANGKPDLSGVWMHQRTPLAELKRLFGDNVGATNVPGMEAETVSKYAINILVDFKPEDSPMRPEAAQIFRRRAAGLEDRATCLPVGVPLGTLLSEPFKIVQSPPLIAVLFEDTHRQIYTDGRTLPKEFEQPSWLGYSTGKWDGDTLVVETAGFNDKTWLDVIGHPHSEALRIAERYHRRDFGHLDDEMTFDDPRMYTKPFTIKVIYELQPTSDIFEYFCDENEKDSVHTGKN